MTEIDKMLEFNKEFVEKKGYEEYLQVSILIKRLL